MSDRQLTILAGAPLRAVVPTDFEQVTRFAKMAVMAGMFADTDENKSLAQATMAVLQGMEVGIPPMQAIQQIAIINGRCTIWGDLVPGLIWRDGHSIEEGIEGEGDNRTAWCEITRKDGKKVRRTFAVKDAKVAQLWSPNAKIKRKSKAGEWYEKDNDSPWHRFPDRMLQMRARGFCARDAVPDVLRGLYVREEMEEERFDRARDVTLTAKESSAVGLTPPPAPAEDASTEHRAESEGVQASPAADTVSDLGTVLQAAKTEEDVDVIWLEHMEAVCALGHEERSKADAHYEAHMARVRASEAVHA